MGRREVDSLSQGMPDVDKEPQQICSSSCPVCVWVVERQAVNAQQTEASSGDISRIRRGAGGV